MTIAACHLSPEGVVLGADSATTLQSVDGKAPCHFDYAQKMFEVGKPGSTVGLVTWGLGQIGDVSHRTFAARVAGVHDSTPFESMESMANRLGQELWAEYSTAYGTAIEQVRDTHEELEAKSARGELTNDDVTTLRESINRLSGGYCLAGRVRDAMPCEAWQLLWGPLQDATAITRMPAETPLFWGVPHIMERLIFGFDQDTLIGVLASGKWTGSDDELVDLVTRRQLIQPSNLPIREAIDWIHTVIHTTIRGTKFAKWPHWCGGPVEIAVITTDRPFRWVRHKRLDAAIITEEEAR
ncbi:MAG TPA: hypothetical protein PLU35_07220 [Phycisphaerales bacterium]|nr:hypothetical protein [Phycisphaerales bacterium]